MTMGKRIARLFVLKTRTEVWLVIYAIALGFIHKELTWREVWRSEPVS